MSPNNSFISTKWNFDRLSCLQFQQLKEFSVFDIINLGTTEDVDFIVICIVISKKGYVSLLSIVNNSLIMAMR